MVNCSSGSNFLRLRIHFMILAKNAEYMMVSLYLYNPRKDTKIETGLIKERGIQKFPQLWRV